MPVSYQRQGISLIVLNWLEFTHRNHSPWKVKLIFCAPLASRFLVISRPRACVFRPPHNRHRRNLRLLVVYCRGRTRQRDRAVEMFAYLQQSKKIIGQSAAQTSAIRLHLKIRHNSVLNHHRVSLGANIPKEWSGIQLHVNCLTKQYTGEPALTL